MEEFSGVNSAERGSERKKLPNCWAFLFGVGIKNSISISARLATGQSWPPMAASDRSTEKKRHFTFSIYHAPSTAEKRSAIENDIIFGRFTCSRDLKDDWLWFLLGIIFPPFFTLVLRPLRLWNRGNGRTFSLDYIRHEFFAIFFGSQVFENFACDYLYRQVLFENYSKWDQNSKPESTW